MLEQFYVELSLGGRSCWRPDKASAPDIRKIGAQAQTPAASGVHRHDSKSIYGYVPGTQQISPGLDDSGFPTLKEKLVATLCKSPLLDQTFVRFSKMKEHSGNRHCAVLGPDLTGNLVYAQT
jgi:hypothetical protein